MLSVFAVIFVAELPDKTALASLVLATRHRPAPVWLGSSLALTVQSLVAVAAGSLFALLPVRAVHIGAGLAFLISAVFMWRRNEEPEDISKDKPGSGFWKTFSTTFGIVFIAEWGDLTQVGTAALAAHYHAPVAVFVGSTLALWAVAGIAVFVGNRAAKLLNPDRTKRVAAVVFALVGIALIIGKL
jgi:putative Ca2+/H+ antiporter (TMEM165/GDT1 family)